MGELIFMAILIVVGVAMFIMTYDFPIATLDTSGGASMFPRVVVIIMCVLVAIRIIQILHTKKEDRKPFAFLEIFKGNTLVYVLSTTLYFVLAPTLGFIISSTIYMIGIIIFFHKIQYDKLPSIKKSVIISAITIAAIVGLNYVFSDVLNVLLPVGLIGF